MRTSKFIASVASMVCISSTLLAFPVNADNVKEYDSWKESVLPNYDTGFAITASNENIVTSDDGSSYVVVSFIADKMDSETKNGGRCDAGIEGDGVTISGTSSVTTTTTSNDFSSIFAKVADGDVISKLNLEAPTDSGVYEVYFDIQTVAVASIIEGDSENFAGGEVDVTEQCVPYTNSIWLTVSDGKITDVSLIEPVTPVPPTPSESTTTTLATTTSSTTASSTTPVDSRTIVSTTTPVSGTTTSGTTYVSTVSESTLISITPVSTTTSVETTPVTTPISTTSSVDRTTKTTIGTSDSIKITQSGKSSNNNSNGNSSNKSSNNKSTNGNAPVTGDDGISSLVALIGISAASFLSLRKKR